MNLFRSLLIAPATLGLLAPLTATANEVDFKTISSYSDNILEIDSNSFTPSTINDTLISGGEGLVDSHSHDGGFSETTTASFSADAIIGAIGTDNATASEATTFDYQYGIGLNTSFTGEDSFDVTIDVGGAAAASQSAIGGLAGFDANAGVLTVDGITYSFPVGSATMLVGDATDISGVYSGACAYGGFADYMGNCGTGNSVGVGGAGVTAAMSYAFDGGFTIAGGVSSPQSEILGESDDMYGLEVAYSDDVYGVAVAYSDAEAASYVGLNAFYDFDFATLSAGYESADVEAEADTTSTFFVGMTKEVGPGTFELGYGSSDVTATLGLNLTETAYIYDASYAYPVNDALTITPGIVILDAEGEETTFAAIKASFSF